MEQPDLCPEREDLASAGNNSHGRRGIVRQGIKRGVMIIESAALPDDSVPRSLAGHAYQLLVRQITRHQIPAGEVLVEKKLMAELGIGRTPIREALQRLASEGFLCHMPHRGMYVCELSPLFVRNVFEFRSHIDSYMVRLAAERATEEDISALVEIQANLAKAMANDDIDSYIALDRRFFEALCQASQNEYVAETVSRIFNLHLWLWFFIVKQADSWHELAGSHLDMAEGIIDALKCHQAEQAELIMKLYVSRRHQDMRNLL